MKIKDQIYRAPVSKGPHQANNACCAVPAVSRVSGRFFRFEEPKEATKSTACSRPARAGPARRPVRPAGCFGEARVSSIHEEKILPRGEEYCPAEKKLSRNLGRRSYPASRAVWGGNPSAGRDSTATFIFYS